MFKYNLIGDNDYIFDPQGTILANRGINDIDKFMNLTEDVTHHYKLLKNINKAVDCLLKHIDNNSKILIIVDPDADGYSSATILYQYLKSYYEQINLNWVLHDDKKHGIEGIEIPDDVNLIITPDSGSNDFDAHERLHKMGIEVIVLDHHEIERESEYAIIVNSQLGDYPNLNLSGAGIVFKFCQALDVKLWIDLSSNFYDLVALGCIADSMSMKELETRYYVQKGLNEINNDFFNAILRKQEFSTKGKVNVTAIMFYVSPLINCTIRVGTLEEKQDMFKAFIGEKELVKYKPRGSDEILVPLVDDMARRCTNIKNRQSRMVEKAVQEIEEYIVENSLNDNKILFIHDTGNIDEGITGLVCNKIAATYKKPTIILSKSNEDGLYKGSARGYDKGELKNFKSKVIDTGLFDYALGHESAFGVGVYKENLTKVNDSLNELLTEYSFDNQYDVDFELKVDSLSSSLINDICEFEDLWGKDVDEPYIVIKDIEITEDNISLLGKSENTISIMQNDIKYIMFKTDRELYERLKKNKSVTCVGRASINEYQGNKYPQVIVDNFSI